MPTFREAIAPRTAIRLAAATLGAGATVCLALACLPDLETNPPHAPPPPVSNAAVCGDGIVALERDAGEACDPGEAGAIGCTSDCKIDCAGGQVRPGTNHCYFTVPADSHRNAETACGNRGAHVVTINSEEERAFVVGAFGGDAAAPSWVGLVFAGDSYRSARQNVEPGWERDCAGCFVHAEAGTIEGDAGLCVGDAPDAASWFQLDCLARASVVCEREPAGASIDLCTGGFCVVVPATRANKRYLYVPAAANADEAAAACDALGGHLALFDTQEEREEVLAAVQTVVPPNAPDNAVWIGLASADAGTFAWDDGQREDARAPIWGIHEPAPGARLRAAVSVPPVAPSIPVDIQLARARPIDEHEVHPYVCQY